jgi:hypothetical protein
MLASSSTLRQTTAEYCTCKSRNEIECEADKTGLRPGELFHRSTSTETMLVATSAIVTVPKLSPVAGEQPTPLLQSARRACRTGMYRGGVSGPHFSTEGVIRRDRH